MKPRPIAAVLLLLLSVIAIGWVLRQRSHKRTAMGTGQHGVVLEVEIKRIAVRPSGDHAQLSLTARFQQTGATPLRLEPPLVSLLTARRTPAPRYLGPLLPEPVLPGSGPAEITLHYWVPLAEMKAPMMLEAAGRSYPLDLP